MKTYEDFEEALNVQFSPVRRDKRRQQDGLEKEDAWKKQKEKKERKRPRVSQITEEEEET